MSKYEIISDKGTEYVSTHYNIFSVATETRVAMLLLAKRGYRATTTYATEACAQTDGCRHLTAMIAIRNTKGAIVTTTMVRCQEREEPQRVANPWDPKYSIECNECGHNRFYGIGRSLDRYNWECAECSAVNHTLTETGMSS